MWVAVAIGKRRFKKAFKQDSTHRKHIVKTEIKDLSYLIVLNLLIGSQNVLGRTQKWEVLPNLPQAAS